MLSRRLAPGRTRAALGRASRALRALAVTLPLSLDPHVQAGGAPPRAELPEAAIADPRVLGAIGLLWGEGRVCVSIGIRRGADAPTVGHAYWRPNGGPSKVTVLPVERLSSHDPSRAFDRWSGCASAPEPQAGAALSTLLLHPETLGGPRRRVDLPGAEPGRWSWSLIQPLESALEPFPSPAASEPAAVPRSALATTPLPATGAGGNGG